MKRRYILEAFNSYRAEVIPPGASTIQVEECKRAFFAGASAVFGTMMKSISEGNETTAEDMVLMRSIASEIGDFHA